MIWILECKKRETILDTLGETQSELKCDTRELETIISRLGEIEHVPVYVPHYATCHTSIVSTGKKGIQLSKVGNPNTVYNGYTSDNGYSDILDIVILLSLSIFPHLHIRHTKCIGYSDIMVIVIIWP